MEKGIVNGRGFRFTTVVWGPSFVRGFSDVCLASMLTGGNLPHVAERTSCSFRIYTTQRDVAVITTSSSYLQLAAMMPVEVAVIDGVDRVGRYNAMTQCHADFVASARGEESALVFVNPDVVWADGVGARLLDIVESGKRVVAVLTPRVVKETFVPELLARYKEGENLEAIPKRGLVELSARHLHPEVTAAFANGDPHAGCFASGAYWMADGGYIARQFHMFPLLVVPEDRDAVPKITVDADYCLAACPNPADVYVVEDSDDLCLVDFTSRASALPAPVSRTPVQQMVDWARHHADSRHREFVTHVLRYHWTDPPLGWDMVERQSNELIDAVLAQLVDPDQAHTPTRPSPMRYLSPIFISQRVQQLGVRGAGSGVWWRVYQGAQRKMFGSSLRIKVIA